MSSGERHVYVSKKRVQKTGETSGPPRKKAVEICSGVLVLTLPLITMQREEGEKERRSTNRLDIHVVMVRTFHLTSRQQ